MGGGGGGVEGVVIYYISGTEKRKLNAFANKFHFLQVNELPETRGKLIRPKRMRN